MKAKKWYTSKTEWVNALALIAGVIQLITGEAWLSPQAQLGILALVNIGLRLITGKPLMK